MRFLIRLLPLNGPPIELGPTRLIETGNLTDRNLAYHFNRSYHCQQCGRIWAEWVKEDEELGINIEYYPFRRTCPDHQKGWWNGDIPGSLLVNTTDIFVMPRSVLESELMLLLEDRTNERNTSE